MLERLLIAGLGSIGTRHVRLARELMPNTKIAVLRHRSCQNLPNIGIDCCFTSLDEALQFHPQVAVIANPASMHLDVALPLARAGSHLFIEKPISASPNGVSELIKICRERGLTLMTGYNLRFLPSLQSFRGFLGEKRIGRVLSVRAEVGQFLPSWRPDVDYRQTASAQAALGGGVLLELSHEIDYLRWLFGEIQWVNATLCKQSSLEIDVEDTAHLTLGFAADAGAVPVIATLNMDFVRQDTVRYCIAIGDAGTLRWDGIAGKVEFFEKSGNGWQVLFEQPTKRDDSYLTEWRHFLDCINEGTPSLISGEDGLAVLRITEAARQSSMSQAKVLI